MFAYAKINNNAIAMFIGDPNRSCGDKREELAELVSEELLCLCLCPAAAPIPSPAPIPAPVLLPLPLPLEPDDDPLPLEPDDDPLDELLDEPPLEPDEKPPNLNLLIKPFKPFLCCPS